MNIVPDDSHAGTTIAEPELVLLYFTAQWCAPCKQLGPSMSMLTEAYKAKVRVVKIDADEKFEMMRELGLRAIPALVLMHSDKRLDERIGLQSYNDLTQWLDSHIQVLKR